MSMKSMKMIDQDAKPIRENDKDEIISVGRLERF